MSEPTERTTLRRLPEKAVTDRPVLDAILDEALVAHLAVTEGDQPFVLPMACARDGDRLLLHGSTGSRLMRALASGAPTCATVTLLDGLVYARSAFESSMHYRSASILGRASVVPQEEVVEALRALTEHLLPGRWELLRAPQRKELAATMVLALPLRTTAGPPRPAPDLASGIEVPDHVRARYPS